MDECELSSNSSIDELLLAGNSTCNSSDAQENKFQHLGLPLLETNFTLALVYCIVMSTALFFGVFGNIIIVLVSATTTVMNKVGKHFVINLALADLCVAGFADPMCILGVIKGERWFKTKWILCEVVASMCLTACFCAFMCPLMMTINRSVFACHSQGVIKGERWFKTKWILCEVVASMCLSACFCAFMCLLMMTINRYVFACNNQGVIKGERWFKTKWILCEVVASMCLTACFCAFMCLLMMSINRVIKGERWFKTKWILCEVVASMCLTACFCAFMCLLMMTINRVIKGERWFKTKWILCEVVASMCLTACFCAFMCLLMMTINRYVFVCHNQAYFKIYKRSVCLVSCALCWILAFLFEFPNFVGWGDHYFDQKNHQCIWDRTASLSYTLTVTIGLIGGPLFIMFICFILIFWKIFKSKKDVFALNTDDPMRLKRIWIESFRSSKTLVIIFIAFVICWTPYAVITALDVNNEYATEVHLFITLLAHLHSSLNFMIYMASNKNFRQRVTLAFSCRSFARKYRSSLESHSQNTSDTTKSDVPTFKSKPIGGELWKGFSPAVCGDNSTPVEAGTKGKNDELLARLENP